MKINSQIMIASAAMAGLFTGTAFRVHAAASTSSNAGIPLHRVDVLDASAWGQNIRKRQGGRSSDSGKLK